MNKSKPRATNLRLILMAAVVAAFAIAGLLGAWAGFALFLRKPCGFMAVLAVLDIAVLLRLSGLPSGKLRAMTGFIVVALTIPLGLYLAAVTNIGRAMGMLPHVAFGLATPGFVGLWLELNLRWWDAAFAAIALLLAWRSSR